MKLWEKSKCLNSFQLVVLLKESGSKIQNLAVAYLTELRPYVVVLDLARLTHSYILTYTYGQMFQTEIILNKLCWIVDKVNAFENTHHHVVNSLICQAGCIGLLQEVGNAMLEHQVVDMICSLIILLTIISKM